MNFVLTPTMANIVREVERIGKRVWIVGGAVRDNFMDQEPKDLDFATNYDHDAFAALIRRMGIVQIPDRMAYEHGITRVVDRDTGEHIDFARLRRDDETDGRHAKVIFTDILEEDLARRDLTINAMAAEIDEYGRARNLIDLFGGQKDIEDRLVRFVGNAYDRVTEDYLRMVRACRFTALGDGWRMTSDAHKAIDKNPEAIKEVSEERIRDEIIKALGYDKPSNFFRTLHTTGLLVHVFPDLERGVGVTQNEYHAEPVFDHLLRCLDACVPLSDNSMLRLSALCHDIAKPHTRSVDKAGRVHFYKHEVEGAAIMYAWMRNLRFSRKQTEYVTKLVRHHQWRFEDDSKDKTIRKWLSAVGPEWRDLITLRMADRLGNLKKRDRPAITQKMRELMTRAQGIIDGGAPIFKEDLAIDGNDLKAMGIRPGKIYRTIFSNILGIVIGDPSKNTKEWLTQHVSKTYTQDK